MLYSQLFSKTSKSAPSDDAINAKLLTQAGFISKQMAGVYNYLPLGLRVLNKIQNIIREEINAAGANEILMPALTQEENYKITGRNGLDILFHLQGRDDSDLVLNQSHEEVVTPLLQKFVFSYRDLPAAVYQIQNKFRNEPRAKSGLLRGREFNMKDLYSFHASEADLDAYYEKMKTVYFKILKRLGLEKLAVLTYASGGSFSQYSHEFQILCDVGEDTIHLCDQCNVAVNKEIIAEHKTCPECGNKKLVEKKGIEVGNIFKLRTKFSAAFKFTFRDEADKEQPVEMGCYGMGPSRLMGALVEVFHDDAGIIWPEATAPYQIHLLTLGKEPEIKKAADELYNKLLKDKVGVLYDDRDVSAGVKLGDADLMGLPTRYLISKKTLAENAVEVKKRNEAKATLIPINKLAL